MWLGLYLEPMLMDISTRLWVRDLGTREFGSDMSKLGDRTESWYFQGAYSILGETNCRYIHSGLRKGKGPLKLDMRTGISEFEIKGGEAEYRTVRIEWIGAVYS
jgi:hypothetical protein